MKHTSQQPDGNLNTGAGIANSDSVRASAPFVGSALNHLELSPDAGGLVFIGPTPESLIALDLLLASPEVRGVEANSRKLSDWAASANEIVILSREVSTIIRSGKTAVVYLDSHRNDGPAPLAPDAWEFVCCRLARITLGLADQPAYFAVHGDEMLRGILETFGDIEPDPVGALAGGLNVLRLKNAALFPGAVVAVAPQSVTGVDMAIAIDSFEARRL